MECIKLQFLLTSNAIWENANVVIRISSYIGSVKFSNASFKFFIFLGFFSRKKNGRGRRHLHSMTLGCKNI